MKITRLHVSFIIRVTIHLTLIFIWLRNVSFSVTIVLLYDDLEAKSSQETSKAFGIIENRFRSMNLKVEPVMMQFRIR